MISILCIHLCKIYMHSLRVENTAPHYSCERPTVVFIIAFCAGRVCDTLHIASCRFDSGETARWSWEINLGDMATCIKEPAVVPGKPYLSCRAAACAFSVEASMCSIATWKQYAAVRMEERVCVCVSLCVSVCGAGGGGKALSFLAAGSDTLIVWKTWVVLINIMLIAVHNWRRTRFRKRPMLKYTIKVSVSSFRIAGFNQLRRRFSVKMGWKPSG